MSLPLTLRGVGARTGLANGSAVRTGLSLLSLLVLVGCAHDTNEARLDEDKGIDPRELGAMMKIDCSQRREEVQAARDEAASDFDRVASYKMALKAFDGGAAKIEAAFTKEPDMMYLAEGDSLRKLLQRCQAQSKTFSDELRKFELALKLKPVPSEDEAPRVVTAPAPVPEKKIVDEFDEAPVTKKVKAAKKTKKVSKSALAKRKRMGKGRAVLAEASGHED